MKVLSIDFDWIMEPSIEAYNCLSCGSPLGPAQIWSTIQHKIPNLNPECDLDKFTDLYFFLKDISKNIKSDNIFIGYNHDQIYDFIGKDVKNLQIYNIDHHHDIGYPCSNNEEDIKQSLEGLGCANWVHHINKSCELTEYIWVGNNNSIPPKDELITEYNSFIYTTDLKTICKMSFDKIFICASWEWVPLKYRNLFDILTSVIDKN